MSYRKDILDEIVDTLASISTSSGYNTNVQTVYRKYREPDNNTYPTLWVGLGAETREQNYDDQWLYDIELEVNIVGYTRAEEDPNDEGFLTDASEDLIEDICKCVESMQLKGVARGIQTFGVRSIEPYLDDVNNTALIVVNLFVKLVYDESLSNSIGI